MKTLKNIRLIIIISVLFVSNVFTQEFWNKLPGPEGGWVYSSTIDTSGGTYDGTIFIGTRGGGMFRSIDNGNSWIEINEGIESFTISDLAIGSSVFAVSSSLYRSDDNGDSWQIKENGTPGGSWRALYVDQSSHIYAGHYNDGVYYSSDNGENWSGGIGTGLTDGRIRSITKNSTGELFAGGFNGVHRSSDNGISWTHLPNGMSSEIVYDMLFFQNGPNENVIAVTWEGSIYKSTNNGDMWQLSANGVPQRRILKILINQSNNLFIGTENGIYKSSDFGDNWSISGLIGTEVSSLLINANNELVAGTNHGNFMSQDNGNSWNPVNANFISGPIFDLDVNQNNDIFLIRYEGVFASFDAGINWVQKNIGLIDTVYWDIRINNNGSIFVGTAKGIYRSDNNGDDWVPKGLTDHRVNKIDFNNMNHIFAGTYGSPGGLYRSEDNGDSWTHLPNLAIDEVLSLAINQNNNNIFAGHLFNGVYRSTDNGDTWTQVNNGLTNTMIQSIAVSNDGYVYAGTVLGGMFRSTDNGDNWTEINNGLQDYDIQKIAINEIGHLYIGGSSGGISFSNDNGDNWIPLNNGMPYHNIYDITFDNNDFALAVTGGGIFYSLYPTILPNPTLSLPANGAIDILANPTLEWNTVFGADSYHLQVSGNPNFITVDFEQWGIQNNSLQVTGLDGMTTYYWQVRAENITGGSDWSNTWEFTTAAFPSLTTQAATNVTEVSAQLNAMVNPNNIKIGIGFEYGETSSYSHYVQATPDTLFNASASPVSAIIRGLYTDRDYHFRVVAHSPDGSVDVFGDDQVLHTATYPNSIDVSSPIIHFPNHNDLSAYTPQDYKIIGIPGAVYSKSFADIMQGVHGSDWQAYHDNGVNSGNPEDYFVEFNGGSEFQYGDGNAFWVIYKDELKIEELGVPTIGLNSNEEAEIHLHPGWNLITNPFDRQIEWWKIQQSNTIGPINRFEETGNWQNSDDHFSFIEPYIGYYVFAQNAMTLLIPYGATSQSASSRPVNHTWKMDISLSVEGKNISSSKMGVSKLAQKTLDELDYRKPRAVGAIPSIYFNRPEWDERYAIFASDMRPEIQDLEEWDFTVSGTVNQRATIAFLGIEDIPAQHEVYLVDEIHSVFVNLRDKPKYSFIPVTKKSNFLVFVGNQEKINEELENLIPTEFKLGKNFPNPFNPSTTIPVSLPEESDLSLKVYNVLGQEIKTIFNGTRDTGKHYFRWDGTNYLNQQVAAGIYLYRLNTDKGHTFVGKMVLVK